MSTKTVVVAGHLCLDIVPEMGIASQATAAQMFSGGQLTQVGPVALSPGGAVANTGGVLRILGIDAVQTGKVGDDGFGRQVATLLDAPHEGRHLPGRAALVIDPDVATSYTIVLTPPDIDRIYFHCPGANDHYGAEDIDYSLLDGAELFHFGYPPLMAKTFGRNGAELLEIYRRAKDRGVLTSLDMAVADPGSASGRADWRTILQNTLPYVDIFQPSAGEIIQMLHPDWSPQHRRQPSFEGFGVDQLSELAAELLEMGAQIVVLKLGGDGLYVRSREGGELVSSCYQVELVNAVGSGDATVAGFIAGHVLGRPIATCANLALAVGAQSVAGNHASGLVKELEQIDGQIADGWEKHPLDLSGAGFELDAAHDIWKRG